MKKNICFSISICCSVITTFGQNGDNVFEESIVHKINILTPNENLINTLIDNYTNTNVYSSCNVIFDGQLLPSPVGIKAKGNYSNFGAFTPKVPLKLNFSEFNLDQKYDGLKKINLANFFKDPSFLRDGITYKLLRDAGVSASRTSYCEVYINDDYFGLYLLLEDIDKQFLNSHFNNKNGNLYKCGMTAIFEWEGYDKSNYEDNFEQIFKQSGDDSYSDLIQLHEKINSSNVNHYDTLNKYFDLNMFNKTMAIEYLVNNSDGFLNSGRNFFIYKSTDDNKFYWIPWDYNLTFSETEYNLTGSSLYTISNGNHYFWNKFIQNNQLSNEFFSTVCSINNQFYTLDYLDDYINSVAQLIHSSVDLDPNKAYTLENFEENINNEVIVAEFINGFQSSATYKGIIPSIIERHNLAMNELANQNFSCYANVNEKIDGDSFFEIYPNPVQNKLNIAIHEIFKENSTIHILDFQGRVIKIVPYELNSEKSEIDVSDLKAGIYTIVVTIDEKPLIKRFIKD